MKKIKGIVALILTCVLALSFAACGEEKESGNSVSGTITAAGSTALQPLAAAAAEQFSKKYTDATVNVQPGGSGTGLTQVASGAVEIGNSDIYAKDKSGLDASKLIDHQVCVIGFALVTNNDVTVDNLSKQDVIKIFTGKVTNWKDVNGKDEKITIINRPTSSGTRATFKQYALDGNDEVQGAQLTQDSSGAVQAAIEKTPGAIGYLALSYLSTDVRKSIKVLKFDGVEANKDNITTGKYTIWSYEHMYTNGEPKGVTKAFIDYMTSSEVKPLIEKQGYVPISDMKVKR